MVLCKNEKKILFKPYGKDEIYQILNILFKNHIKTYFPKFSDHTDKMIEQKAFEIVATKVEKISGDLRIGLDIMKQAIE